MCGPKFRPPPYNKTREDANLQPITKPFASWRTLFITNKYFLPYKLGCISTFWQPIGKLKGKIQRKLCILQKCDLYLNQFSNKKGAIGKPERLKKHPIWAAHPRIHLSTKYPPPPGKNLPILMFYVLIWTLQTLSVIIEVTLCEIFTSTTRLFKINNFLFRRIDLHSAQCFAITSFTNF